MNDLVFFVPVVLVGILFFVWKFRASRPRSKSLESQKPSQEIPARTTEATAATLAQPKRRFSQAIRSWLPLLNEASKDREKWEEALVHSDMGPQLAYQLLDELTQSDQSPLEFFRVRLKELLSDAKATEKPWARSRPWVVYIVGVNGGGKTTSVAKLARLIQQEGKTLGVIGADTFRKAAIEQLETWCTRLGVDFFSKKMSEEESEGADPSAVIFDGLKHFSSRDVILVDTSGRLHTKKNLMDELKKMKRVGDKALPGAPHDLWLVVDASAGQNAIQQAKVFHEAVELTGVILSKMDGLSKGGTVFQLFQVLRKPIFYLGTGEAAEDLKTFDPTNFVEELFDQRAG